MAKRQRRSLTSPRYLYEIKKKYGLTPLQLSQMRAAQWNKCAICKQPAALVVDHDHATGKVRGLLCSGCNSGLGMFRDDFSLLWAAADYLREREGIA